MMAKSKKVCKKHGRQLRTDGSCSDCEDECKGFDDRFYDEFGRSARYS